MGPGRAAKPNYSTNNRRRLGPIEIMHKRLVDFDLVEWKRLQVGQGKIAGPEIVHRNAHAQCLETAQNRHCTLEVVDQHTLGDLQLQAIWRQPAF